MSEEIKAVSLEGMTVVCDHCTFEEETHDLNKFLNKECPNCDSKDFLITDNDIKAHEAMQVVMGIVNDIAGPVDIDADQMVKMGVKFTDGSVKDITIKEGEKNDQ